ncbi:MAG: fibro-slime domain-containing protein [Fibrobacterota bacterium]|nr:fibro-slime domain-containing protein [Fibrobacterota bacterium]
MPTKNLSLLALLAVVFLNSVPALAQPPTDSLNGKTIHLYVESDNFNNFWFQNGDIAFKKDSKYNYSLTLSGIGLYTQDFFFTSNGTAPEGEHYKWKFGKNGLSSSDEGRIKVADFAGKQEIWVVVDPSGPVTAPPIIMFEAPKTLNILNPWPTTAPKIVWGTKTRAMTTTPGRCGWFTSLILDPTMTKIHFAEVNDADHYGKGGYGGTDDYDLAAEFAAKGKALWLNTESNSWTPAWPNLDGECQYMMAATVRDFSKEHPDFDFPGLTGDFLLKGMVEPTIGADRKPVRSAAPTKAPVSFSAFAAWWKTDTNNIINPKLNSYESCVDIPMSKSSDGLWEYDSYRDSPVDHSFFPIEGTANRHAETMASCYVKPPPDSTSWVTNGPLRNGNFCMESHATFIYQPGQRFAFRGDDDVWVYINDKLVVDLGGVHTPKSDSIELDKLNLTPGKEYKWDFFYCDRQPCGSSLRVKTSIFFKQQRSLFKEEIPGATGLVRFKILKREGGKGSCSSLDTATKVVPPAILTYQLLDASGKVVQELKDGVHFTGITIATPDVTIDTAKITGLVAGPYRLVTFEPANEKVRVEIPFRVPARNQIEFEPPYAATAPVGTLVRVIAANREKGVVVAAAEKYLPAIPTGLDVYLDEARTLKQVAGSSLTTEATGYDTLWVTGTATATADQTYIMSIPGSSKTVTLTFTVPKNRVEFEAPLARDTLVGSLVTLNVANREGAALMAKAEAYTLVIPAGLKVFADGGKTVPVLGGTVITTDATGLDVLYATADSTDPVDKTYTLEIVGSAKKMILTFRMPPLDLPKAISAAIHDDDADGIGDRIAAVYDRDITASGPKQIGYQWLSTAAAVTVTGADPARLIEGTQLTYRGKLSTDVLTGGEGVFHSTYPARGKDSTQVMRLVDRMGPIIKTAVMVLGKTEDTLRIRFSEPIAVAGITDAAAGLFSYKRMKDGTPEQINPTAVIWGTGGMEVSLVFANTAADAPRAGNLVRIDDGPGRIADAEGNGSGPAARFRVIAGDKRSEILTVTYKAIAPDQTLLLEKGVTHTLQPVNAVVAEVVERTGRMGHLIKTDLGGYAVKDDFSTVEASQVVLEYYASYFTNFGEPVAESKQTVSCTDALFQGDCLNNRGYLFVGWNYTSKQGTKVATGAYVVRIRYKVKVAGKVMESGGLDQIWGILRRN